MDKNKVNPWMISTILCAGLFLGYMVGNQSSPTPSHVDIPTTTIEDDAFRLFELSGGLAIVLGQGSILEETYSKMGLPQEVIDKFLIAFSSVESIKQFSDMQTTLIIEYFTHEDIKSLIRFYMTPLGRRLAENQLEIFQKGYFQGYEIGEKIGQEILEDYIADIRKESEQ